MNIVASSRQALARMFGRAAPSTPGGWWVPFPPNQAGIRVNEANALTYSAVWACVKVISESTAALGWKVFAVRDDGSKEHQVRSPANELLQRRPNPEQTPYVWREQMLAHALLWGNAYSEIERDGAGRPVGLWPITPDRVRLVRLPDMTLWYEVRAPEGFGAGPALVPSRDMLHFRGLGYDGLTGYSVVRLAALSMSVGVAAERFGASFFGNGAHVSGVLKHPGKPSEEARKNLRESWERAYQGVGKAMRTALLWEGMDWQQIGVPPEDAQFLQTRQFQVVEIARWFRVPPHKIADLERATFSNIEEQSIAFVTDTIVPWATRLEQEADAKLLVRPRQFTRINLNALLRGNTESRFKAYAGARQWGWLSVNDIRRLEDMDPIGEQGDIYLSPLNMADAQNVAGDASGEPAPASGAPSARAAAEAFRRHVVTPDEDASLRAHSALCAVARNAVDRVVLRERRKLESVAGLGTMAEVHERMKGFAAGHAEWCEGVFAEVAQVREALELAQGPDPAALAKNHADRLFAWLVAAVSGDGIGDGHLESYDSETRAALFETLTEDA